jgi:hypothetical protein
MISTATQVHRTVHTILRKRPYTCAQVNYSRHHARNAKWKTYNIVQLQDLVTESSLDSSDRWPSGLRRQLKVISSGNINNRWSERAWVQIPLCSTYFLFLPTRILRLRALPGVSCRQTAVMLLIGVFTRSPSAAADRIHEQFYFCCESSAANCDRSRRPSRRIQLRRSLAYNPIPACQRKASYVHKRVTACIARRRNCRLPSSLDSQSYCQPTR